jgi:phage major head subunit gpT-like protein
LKESALENAIVGIRTQLDHKGQLYLAKADTLIVPPQLEKEARILLNTQVASEQPTTTSTPTRAR